MKKIKSFLLLALVAGGLGVSLGGCVFEDGGGHHGGGYYRHHDWR